MAFDTSKLVKLSALQSLATKVATDYAKKSELATLQETVQGIVSTGGQANVLEGVKVNGTALTIADKIATLTIAEGATDGTLAVNGTDVAVHGYDDLQQDVTDLTALVGTLPEDATATTVVSYIDEAVGAGITGLVDGAPEMYDTLKELADYAASDATAAASMLASIQSNATNITNLTTTVGAIPVTASSTANGNIKIDDVETTVYTLPDAVLDSADIATDTEVAEMLADVFGTESDE